MTENERIKIQIDKVVELVNEKKNHNNHQFLDTLLNKLQKQLNDLENMDLNNIKNNPRIKGALRAYFDTNLAKSYTDPLVLELDKLEVMLTS
ncbi:hypothetical protein [Gracilibacillus saliphilus]|uniref:hypothetical protein n=1 Tax=Gracilibacillus saliphilus TaxID=543890 RepID=UPI0013D00E24|nr:hypothetical protein [Gracilibacillus saliphilus]